MKKVEMVISRFNEDLAWTEDEPFAGLPCVIYNKGANSDFRVPTETIRIESLPNLGREGHTYLHHIVSNYGSLAEITVFLPGSANHPCKIGPASNMVREVRTRNCAVFANARFRTPGIARALGSFVLDSYVITDARNLAANPESSLDPASPRPFGRWFRKHFDGLIMQYFVMGGIFSIARRDVLQHPKSYYQGFLRELCTTNPEAGHFVERSWTSMFYPLKDTIVLAKKENNLVSLEPIPRKRRTKRAVGKSRKSRKSS